MDFKTFAAAVVAIGMLLGLSTLALNTAYNRGHTAGTDKVLAEWKNADLARTEATNKDFAALIDRSNRLQDQLDTKESRHHQEQTRAQAEIDRLHAAVRTGTVRMSVPTIGAACPASPGLHQDASPATGPATARTELDPATADALVTITADGDTAIRDLNACIERYDTVRQAVNAPLTTAPQE